MNMSGWEPRNLSASASAHLDVIRAAAAWAVMWGHLRTLFFVDFQHLHSPGWLLGALYFFTGFGHQAVMVFFVLSGFLISATVIKSHISGTWSWREYAINRSTRLYVVLIPGLLLGSLWDSAGSALFASTGLYTIPSATWDQRSLRTTSVSAISLAICFFCRRLFVPHSVQTRLCGAWQMNSGTTHFSLRRFLLCSHFSRKTCAWQCHLGLSWLASLPSLVSTSSWGFLFGCLDAPWSLPVLNSSFERRAWCFSTCCYRC